MIAHALVGSAFGIASASLIPALQFRLEAGRDAMSCTVIACVVTACAAMLAGLAAAFRAMRAPAAPRTARPWRGYQLAAAFLLPAACTIGAVQARRALIEREDPLLLYVERGLSRALAQPGIGSEAELEVNDGQLTLVVPTYLVRRATWQVDVDAGDTEGRRCDFHAGVIFGDDPVVLRIPVPLRSEDGRESPFSLIPGSMVVVRSVRLAMDPKDPAAKANRPAVFLRQLDLVYEVPALPRGARASADFVAAPSPIRGRATQR